ncbi:MAG: glutamine--fructose-6-phosphate transaminase (isomerizing) [Nitrososphaerales archaeon]
MCGIIGCVSDSDVLEILLDGLTNMEYRGYDSVGVGVHDGKTIKVIKVVGRVAELAKNPDLKSTRGKIGLAHTRWATHGGVTPENAHPHLSCDRSIAVVHNGIIENYQLLKNELELNGHIFRSTTDTEIIPHLIEEELKTGRNQRDALLAAVNKLKGSYAFLVLFRDLNDRLYGVRKDAPLIIGLGENKNFVASDVLSFLKHTKEAIFLDNFEVAEVRRNSYTIWNFNGEEVLHTISTLAWEATSFQKKEFTHYTLKEIHEQRESIFKAFNQDINEVDRFCLSLQGVNRVYIIGAGTSYHAALIAKHLFIKMAKLPAEVILASEFEDYIPLVDEDTLLLAISQSGETADVLSAINVGKRKGASVLSIVNTPTSSLARESDYTLYLKCGPEVGVAATKSFTAQLAVIYSIAFRLSNTAADLQRLSKAVNRVFDVERQLAYLAQVFLTAKDCYFIGRGLNYPIALEGALKLKELSYIHAEGFAAGELKHGTLALISEGVPIVALNPNDKTYHDTLSNVAELKARGAKVIGVSDVANPLYDYYVEIPSVESIFYPIVEVIPLQMFAYYSALERGQNPDYPRNLAKSVTVK